MRLKANTRVATAVWLAAAAVAAGAPLALPACAGAVVTTVNTTGGTALLGIQPRSTSDPTEPPKGILSFSNPNGGPVVHSSADYAIYWDPEYGFHGDWERLVNGFLHNLGQDSGTRGTVSSVDAQYTDRSNGHASYAFTFRGAYTDRKPYPSNGCVDPDTLGGFPDQEAKNDNIACLTDTQVKKELQEFIASNHLPTGMNTVFYMLTPPGVTVCIDGGGSVSAYCSDNAPSKESQGHSFCSYHGAISPTNPTEGDANTVLYAVIPWTAGGLADLQLFDEAPGYECQDGGYDPTTKPTEQAEGTPNQQEPNQPTSIGPDGTFDGGLADLIVNQVSVEQRDIATDPLLNAWHDSEGNEVTDECRNFFAATLGGASTANEQTGAGTLYNQSIAGGNYYLNDTFNFAALLQRYPAIPCIPGIVLEPQFTSPNTVNAGDIVGFDAEESNVTLDAGVGYSPAGTPFETYPTYTWSFGDGTKTTSADPPGAAQVDEPSAFHSYRYGGTYEVTLTVTDVGGNSSSVSKEVTVVGPAPPSPTPSTSPTPPASGPASSSSTGASTTSTASTNKTKGLPAPSIRTKFASHSLSKALSEGLSIRYTVNEQVAGGVEVMLDSKLAKRLGIHRRGAVGLPKGYPRSTVIGYAVLVTTKKGHGELEVKLPKTVAARLSGLHKLKLTLRIHLRNAARHHPKTTTLLSVVELKG